MRSIYIIKAGDTFEELEAKHGGFEQWIIDNMKGYEDILKVVNVEKGEELPNHEDCLGVIMTGSHSMVTEREDWSEKTAKWIREAVLSGMPYFGICYGHQLLADAMGGEAGYNPFGMEIGTVEVSKLPEASEDLLFKDMPDVFDAHVIHSQSAMKLPAGAVCLAKNKHESHHAFRIGDHAWGVQFHPEFGEDAMRGYVERYRTKLDKAYELTLSAVRKTPEATSLLSAFAEYCKGL
jgi:GMP synthase (glutamine-hydrolysing)